MARRLTQRVLRLLPLAVILLTTGPAEGRADDEPKKVDSALHMLTDAETIYVNIDNDPFVAWLKPIFGEIDARFDREAKPRTIVFQAILHPDRPAEVAVSGRPALTDDESKAVLKPADPARSPRTRVVDTTVRIVAKVNGGSPGDSGPLVPPLPTPEERRRAQFRPLSTPEKRAFMQKWARTEAIPLLAACARHRDDHPEDEAIRKLGKALRAVPPRGRIDVAALTEKDRDYWRALMAAPAGDPLVPAAQVALFVANGEIRRARRVADASAPFEQGDWGAHTVLAEFREMQKMLNAEVEARIRKGIELNDRGQLDEAEQIYDAVLRDDPTSAWALYERFQTGLARGNKSRDAQDRLMASWPGVRKAILDADPLYEMIPTASGPSEVYDLLLRRELLEIPWDGRVPVPSVVRRAEIASELGQHGYAAILYWNLLKSVKPAEYGDRKLIEDFLYCLEQLGIKDLKQGFPGDHAAEFTRIDDERAKRRRESVAYRKFVDPPGPAPKAKAPDR
jgi:hypothetical protein